MKLRRQANSKLPLFLRQVKLHQLSCLAFEQSSHAHAKVTHTPRYDTTQEAKASLIIAHIVQQNMTRVTAPTAITT
jgi:hypothetical protein